MVRQVVVDILHLSIRSRNRRCNIPYCGCIFHTLRETEAVHVLPATWDSTHRKDPKNSNYPVAIVHRSIDRFDRLRNHSSIQRSLTAHRTPSKYMTIVFTVLDSVLPFAFVTLKLVCRRIRWFYNDFVTHHSFLLC